MNARDYDYIENRLLTPALGVLEAIGRLRQNGRPDLAERLMAASQALTDECRAVRHEMAQYDRRGL